VEQSRAVIVMKRREQYLAGAATDQAYRLSTLAVGFLEYSEMRLRPSTVGKYRTSLDAHILPEFGSMDVRFFHYPDFERFIYKLSATSPSAARGCLSVLRAMFTWLVSERVVESNPLLGRKQLVERTATLPRKSVLSPLQIHHFLNEIDEQQIPKDAKVILMVQLHSGLRIGEVCGLTWSQIDAKRGYIHHTADAMKSREEAYTALSEALLVTLLTWKREKADRKSKRVFSDEWDTDAMVDLLRNRLSHWIKFTTHDIRRTVSSTLQAQGCPEEIRRRLLNHKVTQGVARSYDTDPQLGLQLKWLEAWSQILTGLKADPKFLVDDSADEGRAALLAQFEDVL
jgi:integrase